MTDAEVTPSGNTDEVVDVEGAVALYVELRDKIRALTAQLKEDLKPYQQGIKDLDVLLLKVLQDQKAVSIKTTSGTIYQRTESSATVKDKKAFVDFVIEGQHWDLVDWRANKVQVREFPEAVPGVNLSAYMTIGVRRGTTQEDSSDE